MQNPNVSISDLLSDTEVLKWFRKIPWCLAGQLQSPEDLLRTIRQESACLSVLEQQPNFTLALPISDLTTAQFNELLYSVALQTWPHWRLILIEDAKTSTQMRQEAQSWVRKDFRIQLHSGDQILSPLALVAKDANPSHFLVNLQNTVTLHPQALSSFAKAILSSTEKIALIYTNEAYVDTSTWPARNDLTRYLMKCRFDQGTLVRANFIGKFFALKASIVQAINSSHIIKHAYSEYEFLLRASDESNFVAVHLPVFSCFRSNSDTAIQPVGQLNHTEMVKNWWHERGKANPPRVDLNLGAKDAHFSDENAILFKPTKNQTHGPKVLALIPFRDSIDMTLEALDSLLNQETAGVELTILLINNRSSAEARSRIAAKIAAYHKTSRVLLEDFDEPFNYNRMHNLAIARHGVDFDYLLFVNNDIEFTTKSTLVNLVGELEAFPKVGICGLRLHYPESGAIQHASIKLLLARCGSGFSYATHVDKNPDELPFTNHAATGVTFALALVRKSVFDELGGLNELHFPNGYGDTDFCMRLHRAGYGVFYLGSISAVHKETATRPHISEDAEIFWLNQTHTNLVATWRDRLRFETSPIAVGPGGVEGSIDLPLRYKIADRLNNFAKRIAGPLHNKIKRQLRLKN